ncbi:procollagen galactosyltransferase 2 precursor [Danio rerio]|uniref:Collagen beta(1-O)galactosyltransferase 2 n=1 Tax=Danio rerio TaxID=7955 RepID=A9C3Q0_DANRE|nr:procollagen galactosyltransferase 2 precursor [Danio rerio]CAP19485.1 novel protein similar to vertebrate glycosyltransferase 25 domain containing 1 (GLT25D1) [Danio rerio]|eukprot:NP_001123548.1 procollagen galactosyltransferase 2 precursor [Danio rerio]
MPAEGFVFAAVICAVMAQNCSGELMAHVQDPNPVPESSLLKPKVMIAILARNSAHSLPYYLDCIDRLDYPKDRIAIWAATDHNVDNSTAMLREWLKNRQSRYHYVEWRPMEEPRSYTDEWGPKHWSSSRVSHVMKLRQAALKAARARWADYILYVDSDNLLTNPRVLNLLMAENLTLVAPMLDSRSLYSNFWCGITPQGYYKRTPDYQPIREWKRLGCFSVPMVHSTFLLDLRRSATLDMAFYPPHPDYSWAFDDIMVFAFSAREAGVQMYVCNREHYGFLPVPLKAQQSVEDEEESFTHTITEAMIDHNIKPSEFLFTPSKPQDKMSFDEIFLINLKRRFDRRERMLNTMAVLGLEATLVDAVDGKTLNTSQLQALGIEMMPGYKDPYSGRVLTRGEIGCFLSHHFTWKQVLERGLRHVLVLEDDVRFEPRFKRRLQTIMKDVEKTQLNWDLIYVGRKRMQVAQPEVSVEGVNNLVEADYSYWTLGYALSQQGAKKLLAAQPLGKMLPVDEFLPVMFNKHPNSAYMSHFDPRDLRAFSVEPLLLYPTHYTGEPGYFSDTETSTIWDDESVNTDWDRQYAQKTAQQAQIRSVAQNSVTGDTPAPASRASRDEL